jgi:SNF2 family DNA or RNA helicase
MIILHAGYGENVLLFWGESSATSGVAVQKRRRDRLRACFDSGDAGLAAIAAELGIKVGKRAARDAVAWLPSLKTQPIPSSTQIADEPASEARCVVPWIVTVVPLEAKRAIELLMMCGGNHLLRPGLLVGPDVAFWAAALRFAAGLVIRGQFLPALNVDGGGAKARWQPVFSGPDAQRLHALAKAMPAAARALMWNPDDSPVAAEAVLRRFLGAVLDELVRSSPDLEKPGTIESVHDQWLSSLSAPNGAMPVNNVEASNLAAQIEQWQRPIQVSARSPFRLCFRLEEPEDDSETWVVRYLLQGTKDPSLMIPTSEVWNSKTASLLATDKSAVKEHLLASLGQATGVWPRIDESLRERAPSGCRLNVNEAYAFLRENAAALEQSGFGVMLPGWWTRRGAQSRIKARANVKAPALASGRGLSLESVVNFDWEIALGDEKVSASELAALARAKAALVRIRGQWVEVDSDDIQAALEFLEKKPSSSATLREVIQMALGSVKSAGTLELDRVDASGWVAEILAQLEGKTPFEELPQPEGVQGTLRPYQLRGYSWLLFLKRWGLGACLADDMGLGKTIQTLALIQHEHLQNGRHPVLLVCPTSVVGNWQKEAARFTPDLPVLVHHGVARHKGAAFQREASKHAMVVSSYSLLQRDLEILQEVPWAGVILDEAQNIKNPETKQARAARSLGRGYRIALTGTPVENHVGDLWSIMEFLNPGFLGSQSGFKKQFFVPIQVYGNQQVADRLRRITGPFLLRRLKTDKSIIADLPDKLEMKVFCTLTKEQASLYAAVVKDVEAALESTEGIERKGLVLATLSKLKQVCNHPAQFLKDGSAIAGRSGKLARLTEMLEEALEAGDRSLIFTQFREMGELIQSHLREAFGVEVLFLHGGTPKAQRDRMVERFAQNDGPRIFLLSLKAGGTGLNLTRASHVFHFDRWWNPAVENQATDRAFRIGQTKNVQVHKFLCVGTLEEKIDAMIERKKDVAGRVVGTGEGWLTELSNVEIKNLFALRQEAIGE